MHSNSINLSGVPETMLWPLWNRAAEQRRDHRLLCDPLSAALVNEIDYDFRGHFGAPSVLHVVRARLGDDLIHAHCKAHPERPVVVALGDGLDTQAWRIDSPQLRWFSVDVPEAIQAREHVLPRLPHATHIACSATDPAWLAQIPADSKPFITASGLLMYFEPEQVVALLSMIAARFDDATVFFDTIPPFLSRKTLSGYRVTRRYTAPPMPWGLSVDDIADFIDTIPGLYARNIWTYADPFPARTRLYKLLSRIGPLRRRLAGGLVLAGTRHHRISHGS